MNASVRQRYFFVAADVMLKRSKLHAS